MRDEQKYKRITAEIKQGYDVNKRDRHGLTLLHKAADTDDIDIAKLLVSSNADVNIKVDNGGGKHSRYENKLSPLHQAAYSDSYSVAKLLIDNGADIHALDENNSTPLHNAASGNSYSVAKLLVDNGADIHARDETNSTPLHNAAIYDAYSVAKLLIDNGGGIHALDNKNRMPIHRAAEFKCLSVLKLLILNGAEINAITVDMKTPLHCVVDLFSFSKVRGREGLQVIHELINHGADINAAEKEGNTPLHLAAFEGAEDVIEILMKAGADENIRNISGDKPEEMIMLMADTCIGENFKKSVEREVRAHLKALLRKQKQLIQVDDYGLVDRSKWDDELEYFTMHVLVPKLDSSKTYTKWVLRYIESYVGAKMELVKVVEDAFDAACYALDDGSYNDDMDPVEYESMCADILSENGWDARITSASGDQGVDVFAEKDGCSVVLQCKKYTSPVGNKAVQEAHAGRGFMGASAAAVVTNASYTQSAKQLASTLDVLLLHHDELADISSKLKL